MKIRRVEHVAIARTSGPPVGSSSTCCGLAREYEEKLPQCGTRLAMYLVTAGSPWPSRRSACAATGS